MKNFKIITSGDKNYFNFLWRFEKNIFKQFGEYPIIYDLGLTDSQKDKLNSVILKTKVPPIFSEYTSNGFIKAVHKPFCVADFFEKYGSNCLFLDADILFRKKIKNEDFLLEEFDIGVTPRHLQERYDELYKNGLLNSGTIYFNHTKKTLKFISLWIEECKKENTSDQLALSNLVAKDKSSFFSSDQLNIDGLGVKLLDPKKYNDVSLGNGLILHYKNAGRSKQAYQRYIYEYYIIQNSLPIRNGYLFFLKITHVFERFSRYFFSLFKS